MRFRPTDDNEGFTNESWQTSFLDIFMLLLAFFIILAGLARYDMRIFDDDARGLRSIIQGTMRVQTPIDELRADIQLALSDEIETDRLMIQSDRDEMRLSFTDARFFETARAELLPEGKELIDRIMEAMAELKFYQYYIDVEGHTDNRPINTLQFPSNWELSTARAANIIRYFMERGFEPSRLKASGYAETRPIVPNQDELGNNLPDNQALNRRVVVRIYY
ncbi:MAG: OmpA family protein [Candidatus Cyclonatronum sp.]|uniref:OmpA/MotB family protein n=1 Tax=Cyclonatronum sp. TaxID=3024185 RepID=UPI0025B9C36F|nr:OmpA family protein [Cyclonatronum sp.]MCC5935381.1 OmpA family protein [Balneolales bacterium]MCH8487738.1 OmpA family protein [Cyclonatronum sp.]